MEQETGAENRDAPRRDAAAAHRERARWISQNILPHEAELRRALQRRAPVGFEADDIVQEIYARLAALACIDHIHNPRSYMFRMASGVMTDYIRRQTVVPMHGVDDLDAAGAASVDPSPETVVLHRDEVKRLARVFAQLPPRVAEVFRLRRLEGLSQREVSHRLGLSESTIEKRMARGVYLIAQSWEDGGNTPARSTKTRNLNPRRDDPARDR
ncbi:sigma-70 family RNA polymerase sigma factor [Brevundimonas sp. SORGH_AS_0993]|uniref:sigma-70 family RNA polymerase sigma factor n=1 Tax=Brevundimonas sp. SORGH_AS_0993 TaxID=3041794 RepID=UPI002782CE56|nr:sigma-70 family RNA polymerase sigma factor [Brevundimonas sp. SORGH_AS_0993]MDQ1153424.1 RNA polymerase sigma factor (sigma-70 family) [Brevundimonas sp. SORGH_AS_0993]